MNLFFCLFRTIIKLQTIYRLSCQKISQSQPSSSFSITPACTYSPSLLKQSQISFSDTPIIFIQKSVSFLYNITQELSRNPVTDKKMSQETNTPLQDDTRYDVSLNSSRQGSYIVYRIWIVDLAIGIKYEVKFRFSEIKKMHEDLMKKYKALKDIFPQFPKTNSIGLWNRTNKDHRKIQQRRRELEYYIKRTLNNSTLRGLAQVKGLLINASKAINRTQSNMPFQIQFHKLKRAKSLPQMTQKIMC